MMVKCLCVLIVLVVVMFGVVVIGMNLYWWKLLCECDVLFV